MTCINGGQDKHAGTGVGGGARKVSAQTTPLPGSDFHSG